jgi:hypothetical protein
MTTRVTNASPPTIQGRLLERVGAGPVVRARPAERRVVADAATGVPHSWQNFDPGVRDAPQAAQFASRTTAPHAVQNRPWAGAPHAGHGMADDCSGADELMTGAW